VVAERKTGQFSRRTLVKAGAAATAVSPFLGVRPALAQDIPEVPRNRTLILRLGGIEGRLVDYGLWNGYAIGANHQTGLGIFYEPVAFYSAFADETIPWLAESWEYNEDFTQLRIKTRSGITWSDGEPFSAEDVAFTLTEVGKAGSKIRWGVDVQQFVESATAESETEVLVTFKVPAPRFFYFMTYKYDIGLYIVPKHIFEGQEFDSFTALDIEKGWPVTTAPWRVVYASPEQKVIDRRDEWWAVEAGLVDRLPDVERIVYLPFTDQTQVAQQFINNAVDMSGSLAPATMQQVLAQNPAITTHTGNEPPYGYVDWWPTSLYVNNEQPPFDDPNVRWGLSYFINREQVIEVALLGAGSIAPLPMPTYPGLMPYYEAVEELLEQYPTTEFNPEKGAARLQESGWAKNDDGVWEKDGSTLDLSIIGPTSMAEIGPVISEQMRQQGVNAEFALPPDFNDRFQQGNYSSALYGHGGSVSGDPYFTLRLYQSATEAVPGAHQVNFAKWHNEEYDRIVDEMSVTPPDDQAKLLELWHEAMEIWLPELPDIQVKEFYHRIPMNTTYWQNWPTEDNAYVNGAFWHLTFALVLKNLEAVQ
jgi:peptide/nickel transport system substrate-binding protein